MGFLIYKKFANAETVRYEQCKPLRLAGCGRTDRPACQKPARRRRAKLKPGRGLLKLAGLEAAADEYTIMFDVAGPEATNVCLYELSRVHGSSRDTATQLVPDFTVVVDREMDGDAAAYVKQFEIAAPERPRQLGETLALTGGPGGGDWKWTATSLQLGATVVRAQHGHGGGEPCPNCSCGRREAIEQVSSHVR